MCAKFIKANGQYAHRSTYRPLSEDELKDPNEIRKRKEFMESLTDKLGPACKPEDFDIEGDLELGNYDLYAEDDTPEYAIPDRDDLPFNHYDVYLNAEVKLPNGDSEQTGTVKSRKRDINGQFVGTGNSNPILDTRVYNVEFPDGSEKEFSANLIAESMISQCDEDGNQCLLLDSIIDHRKTDEAITDDQRYVTHNGRQYERKTTKGWQVCVQWRDGTTSWEKLSTLKESNPVELAEYAVASGIDAEPAFHWWVRYTLKKRDRIIAAVNRRYHKRTHKFGIRLPKTVKEAYELDRLNGNTMWADAIKKEMKNVRVAFKILTDDEKVPVGSQYIDCHGVFDVKMNSFQRKFRLVGGGHQTETPATLTYASVVSRESVRIALTLAALNDLEVKAADIQNAYLTAPNKERIWTRLGPEFGGDEGKRALVVRALYGLKFAGASYRSHFADCLRHLGYHPCLADPDIWMKFETRPDDGYKYYAYILVYVDD